MNHLIVLPGNSVKNKAWGESVVAYFGQRFDSVHMMEYNHWKSGEQNINFSDEIGKMRAHITELPSDTQVTVFAKSAGSLLAFMAIEQRALVPQQCVFFGTPFDLAATELFKDNWGAVDTFSIPALAFHNVDDPTTSFEFTKEILETHAPKVTLIATNESDHWYGDFQTYDTSIVPCFKQ